MLPLGQRVGKLPARMKCTAFAFVVQVIVDKTRGWSGCPQSQLSAQCESQGLRGPGRTNTGAGSVFSQS